MKPLQEAYPELYSTELAYLKDYERQTGKAIENAADTIAKLRWAIEQKEARIKELEAENERRRKACEEMREEIMSLQGQIDKLQKDLDYYRRRGPTGAIGDDDDEVNKRRVVSRMLKPLNLQRWETCELCRFAAPMREMREVKHKGRRVRVCHKCWCDIFNEQMKASEGSDCS